ncbi:hypothetical protein V5O39_14755 [Pseudomonas parakoreensis]
MAEKQILPMEAADGPTDVVAQGTKSGSDHGQNSRKNDWRFYQPNRAPTTQENPRSDSRTFLFFASAIEQNV